MQILVLGMHRSGTSATARLVNMMGAYLGPEGCSLGVSPGNPKGFWERLDVVSLNESLLRLRGWSWDRPSGWPDEPFEPPEALRRSLGALILGLDAHRPWFIKDPRLCLTLPAWRTSLEAPVAVMVYRDPAEVAISLRTRDGLPLEYGLALWEYHAVGMLNATRDMPRAFVQHAALLEEPIGACRALYEQLVAEGVRRLAMPGAREIRAFIAPSLYRSKDVEAAVPKLSPHQLSLSEMQQGLHPPPGMLHVSESSREIIRAGHFRDA